MLKVDYTFLYALSSLSQSLLAHKVFKNEFRKAKFKFFALLIIQAILDPIVGKGNVQVV